MNENKLEMKPPAGVVPEGIKPGDEFDLVTTWRLKDTGMICPVMLGDVKMEGYGDKDNGPKSMPAPGYGDYAKGMVGSMGQDQG